LNISDKGRGKLIIFKIMADALIFQLLGLIYLAVGIGIFVNQEFFRKLLLDFTQNLSASYIGGIMALIIGYILVFYHNTWVFDWPILITIVGWLSLIKGLMILIFPALSFDLAKAFKRNKKYLYTCAAFLVVFGFILMYVGFTLRF